MRGSATWTTLVVWMLALLDITTNGEEYLYVDSFTDQRFTDRESLEDTPHPVISADNVKYGRLHWKFVRPQDSQYADFTDDSPVSGDDSAFIQRGAGGYMLETEEVLDVFKHGALRITFWTRSTDNCWSSGFRAQMFDKFFRVRRRKQSGCSDSGWRQFRSNNNRHSSDLYDFTLEWFHIDLIAVHTGAYRLIIKDTGDNILNRFEGADPPGHKFNGTVQIGASGCSSGNCGNHLFDDIRIQAHACDDPSDPLCEKCPSGHIFEVGKGLPGDCTSCPNGAPNEYQSACSVCSAGFYRSDSGVCASCPEGYFQPDDGQSQCLKCAAGRFQIESEAKTCIDCPRGYYEAVEGSNQCSACSPGEFQNETEAIECRECPTGFYQEFLGTTLCIHCPEGYYQPSNGSKNCSACSPGQFQNETEAIECRECPIGYFQEILGEKVCVKCPEGYYEAAEGSSQCSACSPGQFQSMTDAIECQECPMGFYQEFWGKYLCMNCSEGYYEPSEGSSQCYACSAGQFQNVSGARGCKMCPIGFYQHYSGQAHCTSCPKGYYQEEGGKSQCLKCSPGKFQPKKEADECTACSEGYHEPGEASSQCSACSPGEFQNMTEAIECQECPRGFSQEFMGITQCNQCPEGYYESAEGSSQCSACSPGEFQNETEAIECLECLKGFYQESSGEAVCNTCPKGYYQPEEGSINCTACSPGTFQDEIEAMECKECPEGLSQVNAGETECHRCDSPAKYVPHPDAPVCEYCDPGQIPNEKQHGCIFCKDYEVSSVGSAHCHPCAAGRIPDAENKSCIPCRATDYAAVEDSECFPFLSALFLPHSDSDSLDTLSSCTDNRMDVSCATAGFGSALDVPITMIHTDSGNLLQGRHVLQSQSRFTIFLRSVSGKLPILKLSCREEKVADLQVYSGCNPLLPPLDLPVQLSSYDILRKDSCDYPPGCLNIQIAVNFDLVPNASVLALQHLDHINRYLPRNLLSRNPQRKIVLPLKTDINLENEDLVQMPQMLQFDITVEDHRGENNTDTDSHERGISPEAMLVTHERRGSSETDKLSRKVELTLMSGDEWLWEIDPSDEEYVTPPNTDELTIDQNSQVPQYLEIYPKSLPPGETKTEPRVVVSQNSRPITGFTVDMTIYVREAFVRVSPDVVEVTAGVIDPTIYRSISLINSGNLDAVWSARVITPENSSWIQLNETESIIGAESDAEIDIAFTPQEVPSTGIYSAWLEIETDAWDGEISTHSFSATGNVSEMNGTTLMVYLELFVSRVYICPPQRVSLAPKEDMLLPLTVVNVGPEDYIVSLYNVSIQGLDEHNLTHHVNSSRYSEPVLDESKPALTYHIQPVPVGSSRVSFASWLSMFPFSQQITPGTSGTYRLLASYSSADLRLWTIDGEKLVNSSSFYVELELLVSESSNSSESGTEHRMTAAWVDFTPGFASFERSFVKATSNEVHIGSSIELSVLLRDSFGNEGAYAVYYEESSNQHDASHNKPSLVYSTFYEMLAPLTPFRMQREFPTLITGGQPVTGLKFDVLAVALGGVSVDVHLNGARMYGSPLNITAIPVQCSGDNEVVDRVGSTCLCREGFYRSEGICYPCPEGTFGRSVSNEDEGICDPCPSDHFAEPGRHQCYPCPTQGITCSFGKLRLEQGMWCEICSLDQLENQKKEHPKEFIVTKLERGEETERLLFSCRHDEACIVNSSTFETQCNEGYTGPLCDVCESGYAKDVNSRSCFRCGAQGTNQLHVLVQVGILMVAVTTVAYGNLGKHAMETAESISDFGKTMSLSLEEIIMATIDYLQMLAIVISMGANPFPGNLNELVQLSFLDPTNSKRFRCLTGLSVYQSSILSLLLPVPVTLAIMIIQFLLFLSRYCQLPSLRGFRLSLIPTVFRVLNFIHPAVSNTAFSSIDLYDRNVGSTWRLSLDLSIEIGSAKYIVLQVLAGFVITFYVVGFPLTVYVYLNRQFRQTANQLSEQKETGNVEEIYGRFSYLVGGYSIERRGYMWPQIVTLRKVMLSFIAIYSTQFLHRLSYITLLMIGTYFLCITMWPHMARIVTWIELVNTAGISISAALVSIYLHLLRQSDNPPEAIVIEQTLIVVQAVVIIFGLTGILLLLQQILAEKSRALTAWWRNLFGRSRHPQIKVSPDIREIPNPKEISTGSAAYREKNQRLVENQIPGFRNELMVRGRALGDEELAWIAQQDTKILEDNVAPGRSTQTKFPEVPFGDRVNQSAIEGSTESYRGKLNVCGRALEASELASLAQHDKQLAWLVHPTRESCIWTDSTSSTDESSLDRVSSSPKKIGHIRPRRRAGTLFKPFHPPQGTAKSSDESGGYTTPSHTKRKLATPKYLPRHWSSKDSQNADVPARSSGSGTSPKVTDSRTQGKSVSSHCKTNTKIAENSVGEWSDFAELRKSAMG